jgi:hypothetical protein
MQTLVISLVLVVVTGSCHSARQAIRERPVGVADATGLSLTLSSADVQPGDTIRVDVHGAAPTDWIGGVSIDLEVFRRSQWERVYLLLVDWQGPPKSVPAADDVVIPAIGVRPGPFNVLIPEVPKGEYRIRRDLLSMHRADGDHAPQDRLATLYAPITIRRR